MLDRSTNSKWHQQFFIGDLLLENWPNPGRPVSAIDHRQVAKVKVVLKETVDSCCNK